MAKTIKTRIYELPNRSSGYMMLDGGPGVECGKLHTDELKDQVLSNIAPEYSETKAYQKDDWCVHVGITYRAKQDIPYDGTTPNQWDSTQWEQVTVVGRMDSIDAVIPSTASDSNQLVTKEDVLCTPYIVDHNGSTDSTAYTLLQNWYNQTSDYKKLHPLYLRVQNTALAECINISSGGITFYFQQMQVFYDSSLYLSRLYYRRLEVRSGGALWYMGNESLSPRLIIDYGNASTDLYRMFTAKSGLGGVEFKDGGVFVRYTDNDVKYLVPLVEIDNSVTPHRFVFVTPLEGNKKLEITYDANYVWSSRVVDTTVVPKVAVTGTLDSSYLYTVDIPLHAYSTFTVNRAAVEIQVNVPTPSSGEFDEAEFKFTCQGGLVSASSLKFIQNGYVLPIVGNVSVQLDNTKQYQGRVADGIVTIAEAEKATPV